MSCRWQHRSNELHDVRSAVKDFLSFLYVYKNGIMVLSTIAWTGKVIHEWSFSTVMRASHCSKFMSGVGSYEEAWVLYLDSLSPGQIQRVADPELIAEVDHTVIENRRVWNSSSSEYKSWFSTSRCSRCARVQQIVGKVSVTSSGPDFKEHHTCCL